MIVQDSHERRKTYWRLDFKWQTGEGGQKEKIWWEGQTKIKK